EGSEGADGDGSVESEIAGDPHDDGLQEQSAEAGGTFHERGHEAEADAGCEQARAGLAEALEAGLFEVEGAHELRGHEGLLQRRHHSTFLLLLGDAGTGGALRKQTRTKDAEGTENDAECGEAPFETEDQHGGDQKVEERLETPGDSGGESSLDGG